MTASHTFTESAPCWTIHAVDPRGCTPWEHEPDEFDRDAEPYCPACDGTAYMLDGSRCPLCNDPDVVSELARAEGRAF